jgi:phosphatidylserine decarboxylase
LDLHFLDPHFPTGPMTDHVPPPTQSRSAAPAAPPGAAAPLLEPEPMDPQIRSIQPGGGVVMRLELAWGHLRRAYLKTFRRGYVRRMAALRQGDPTPTESAGPHEVLDPRDLKYYRNQPGCWWRPEDDPFTWRDRLPFARAGLAELLVFSVLFFGPAVGIAWWLLAADVSGAGLYVGWVAVATLAVLGGLIVWFFRDPERPVPNEPGQIVSPADGVISTIEELDHDEFLGGPAVLVGIFLSIFNCHMNRAPEAARVIGLRYRRGKFLNALRPESARENEQVAIRLQGTDAPHRRFIVRQITGAIARRIVCWLRPGDVLTRGERVGMIKLGSRTELVLPREPGLAVRVGIGQKVKAGVTVLAEYADEHD